MHKFVFKRVYSVKPRFDLAEYTKSFPSAIDKSIKNTDVDGDLDWSHLKHNTTLSSEEDQMGEVTEQKEEIIFKEVLSQVLSSSSTPQLSQTKHDLSHNRKPLSDSILALFEKTNLREVNQQGKEVVKAETLLDGWLQLDDKDEVSRKSREKRQEADSLLTNTYKHINALATNKEIIDYFKFQILPSYNQDRSDQNGYSPDEVTDTTIPYILEKCIKTLNEEYHDPVGALHLFDVTKHHSVQLFSVACSAEVYNQVISIRWYIYRDLYAVVNLAAEIAINAIPPTIDTTELLSKIYREAMDSSKGMGESPYGMPLWSSNEQQHLLELNRYRVRFQTMWASKPTFE